MSESAAGGDLAGVLVACVAAAPQAESGQSAAGIAAVLLGLALVDCLRQHLSLPASVQL